MAAQSFAMGQAFGTSFQYGKRKISSLSNEEFNALSATDIHGNIQADIRAMIPDMQQSFQRMESFQIDIINSMVDTIKLGLDQLGKWIGSGFGLGGPTTQTSTSAIDFSDTGIVEIQGGSRQDNALTSDNPASKLFLNSDGQTYEEWSQSIGAPEIIEKNKIKTSQNKARVERDIQASRDAAKRVKPIIKIKPLPTFVSQKVRLAQRLKDKKQLIKNIASLKAISTLKTLEYKRFKIHSARSIKLIQQGRGQASRIPKIRRDLSRLRSLSIQAGQNWSNALRLLRNYKI